MENKCKYCGKKIEKDYNATICSVCSVKLKYVKELVALCQVIKKECGRNE